MCDASLYHTHVTSFKLKNVDDAATRVGDLPIYAAWK